MISSDDPLCGPLTGIQKALNYISLSRDQKQKNPSLLSEYSTSHIMQLPRQFLQNVPTGYLVVDKSRSKKTHTNPSTTHFPNFPQSNLCCSFNITRIFMMFCNSAGSVSGTCFLVTVTSAVPDTFPRKGPAPGSSEIPAVHCLYWINKGTLLVFRQIWLLFAPNRKSGF